MNTTTNKPNKKFCIRRTRAARIGALLLAGAILMLALAYTWSETGNPLLAWYAEKKIEAHYRAYHAGESWQIGPAEHKSDGAGSFRYICEVSRVGEPDDTFWAYFEKGSVFTMRRSLVESGYNTYIRLTDEQDDIISAAGIAQALPGADKELPDWGLRADFAAEGRTDLFDPEASVFQPGMRFAAESSPLPTVLWAERYGALYEDFSHETAAQILCKIKEQSQKKGLAFDQYGIYVNFYDSDEIYAIVLSGNVIKKTDAAGEAAVAQYLAGRQPYWKNWEEYNEAQQSSVRGQAAWTNRMRVFLPCSH